MTYQDQAVALQQQLAALPSQADSEISSLNIALTQAQANAALIASQLTQTQSDLAACQQAGTSSQATIDQLTAQVADLQAQLAAVPAPSDPKPLPGGPPAGFSKLLFQDLFPGTSLDPAKWNLPGYKASFSSTAGSKADPANLAVSNGIFSIHSYYNASTKQVVTGGVKSKMSLPAAGGLIRAKLRISKGAAKCAVMAYPSNQWPPEIDYFELGAGDRQQMQATLHYGTDNKQYHSGSIVADFTQWQEVAFANDTKTLTWLLNGAVAKCPQPVVSNATAMPGMPMFPIFQTEAPPSDTPVDGGILEVSYIEGWGV